MIVDYIEKLEVPVPEHLLKTRKGGWDPEKQKNVELTYISGHTAITAANKVFDYNWNIDHLEFTYLPYHYTKKNGEFDGFYVTCIATVTAAGVTKRGVGTGDQKADSADALEGAVKTAETDAVKRALRYFGDAFALNLYDSTPDQRESPESRETNNVEVRDSDKSDEEFICEIEGCGKPVTGFKGADGKLVSAKTMAGASKKRFGKYLCSKHYSEAKKNA